MFTMNPVNLTLCFYIIFFSRTSGFNLAHIYKKNYMTSKTLHSAKNQNLENYVQNSRSSTLTPMIMASASGNLKGQRFSQVTIQSPSMNSRRITASILIDATMDDVWSILTDYNNLSLHVPNLVKSYLVDSPSPGGIRLFQEGAQKIAGFDFRASLTMDMTEEALDESKAMKERKLYFKLAESSMFSSFDGSWSLRYHSRSRKVDPTTGDMINEYKTLLTYTVFVQPRGIVPVIALEWRIREDVPLNLDAVKVAAERYHRENGRKPPSGGSESEIRTNLNVKQTNWEQDETLGRYIGAKVQNPIPRSVPTKKSFGQVVARGILSGVFGLADRLIEPLTS